MALGFEPTPPERLRSPRPDSDYSVPQYIRKFAQLFFVPPARGLSLTSAHFYKGLQGRMFHFFSIGEKVLLISARFLLLPTY